MPLGAIREKTVPTNDTHPLYRQDAVTSALMRGERLRRAGAHAARLIVHVERRAAGHAPESADAAAAASRASVPCGRGPHRDRYNGPSRYRARRRSRNASIVRRYARSAAARPDPTTHIERAGAVEPASRSCHCPVSMRVSTASCGARAGAAGAQACRQEQAGQCAPRDTLNIDHLEPRSPQVPLRGIKPATLHHVCRSCERDSTPFRPRNDRRQAPKSPRAECAIDHDHPVLVSHRPLLLRREFRQDRRDIVGRAAAAAHQRRSRAAAAPPPPR